MRLSLPYRLFLVTLCLALLSGGLALSARTSVAATPTFTDVDPNSTSPYAVAIYQLASRGIVHGYDDGSGRFGPLDPILRAQVAAIVARAVGWDTNQGQADFSDQGTIDASLWNSVRVLADHDVARGFGDGTFHPRQQVAQVQVISFITRAMVQSGKWVSQSDDGTRYSDVPASSGARADLITYDHYAGLIPFATSTGTGGWVNWSAPANRQEVALVVWNAIKTTTTTPVTPTPTPMPTTGQVGTCGEDTVHWHPPVINGCATGHEHGDAPPSWVNSSRWMPMFEHPGNTPSENLLKHSSFKGFSLRDDNVDLYVIMHLDTNPSGHASRFHSVQVWARDTTGAVSHWDYWLDFGTGNMTGPQLRGNGGCEDTNVRPIMAVRYSQCGTQTDFESWYSRAGATPFGWDFGFNMKPNYYAGTNPQNVSNPDLATIASWLPTGDLNNTRRIEMSWYAQRSNQRGTFWSTQWGEIVSGPSDARCGTSRTYGTKTYTTLCIEQYIAPSMTQVAFPGNSVQKDFDVSGVKLPN